MRVFQFTILVLFFSLLSSCGGKFSEGDTVWVDIKGASMSDDTYVSGVVLEVKDGKILIEADKSSFMSSGAAFAGMGAVFGEQPSTEAEELLQRFITNGKTYVPEEQVSTFEEGELAWQAKQAIIKEMKAIAYLGIQQLYELDPLKIEKIKELPELEKHNEASQAINFLSDWRGLLEKIEHNPITPKPLTKQQLNTQADLNNAMMTGLQRRMLEEQQQNQKTHREQLRENEERNFEKVLTYSDGLLNLLEKYLGGNVMSHKNIILAVNASMTPSGNPRYWRPSPVQLDNYLEVLIYNITSTQFDTHNAYADLNRIIEKYELSDASLRVKKVQALQSRGVALLTMGGVESFIGRSQEVLTSSYNNRVVGLFQQAVLDSIPFEDPDSIGFVSVAHQKGNEMFEEAKNLAKPIEATLGLSLYGGKDAEQQKHFYNNLLVRAKKEQQAQLVEAAKVAIKEGQIWKGEIICDAHNAYCSGQV